jgi:hypothetical protein
MKARRQSKQASKRQQLSAAEEWRNSQADARALYDQDRANGAWCPPMGTTEINELYGRPDLNPLLHPKAQSSPT